MFCKLYPSRRTGCDHRQDTFFRDTLDQFMPLFYNSEIGGKLCIKDFIEAESAQTGNHLACHKSAGTHSHRFTDADTDCRCSLYNNYFLRIHKIFKHFICVITFNNSTGWTHECALSAIRTGDVSKSFFHIGGNLRFDAASGKADCIHCLNSAADSNTPAAQDAFVRISDNGRRGLVTELFLFRSDKPAIFHPQIRSDRLQFAVLIAQT